MVWLILAIVAVGAFIWWANKDSTLDVNSDGKLDHKDAEAAVQNAVQKAKSLADLNHDGKVGVEDAVVAVKSVKAAGRTAKAAVAKKVRTVTKKRTKKE
jgi:hypothetical protein